MSQILWEKKTAFRFITEKKTAIA